MEGHLDADERGGGCDGCAGEHRARGRTGVDAHRNGRRDQDREHQQGAEALDRNGHGGGQKNQ
jgi:hypothetical protein